MLATVRQVNGYPCIDVTPKNPKLPQRVDENLDLEERQPAPRSYDNQDKVTLHNFIPPELLNLPQAILGKSAALASYLSNQSFSGSTRSAVSQEDLAGSEIEATTSNNRSAAPDSAAPKQSTAPIVLLPSSRRAVQQAGSSKASAVASYLANNDEPVYVAVPDSVIASSSKASKLREFAQNITETAKNAYYKLMTSVPYSVGMLINVFA